VETAVIGLQELIDELYMKHREAPWSLVCFIKMGLYANGLYNWLITYN